MVIRVQVILLDIIRDIFLNVSSFYPVLHILFLQEAIFMAKKDRDISVAETKINWKGTDEGLRLIVLKRYCLATKEMINSLKSRIYKLL